jgi:hypothetical protein
MAGWQTTEKSAYMKSKDCPLGQSFFDILMVYK